MPREKIGDLTTEGRYVEVNWRRDENEPGYVQVSTHGPNGRGSEYVHLDEAGLDKLIRKLHKAKHQTFGSEITVNITPGRPGVTVESDTTAAARLDTEGYRRAREGWR